MKALSRWGVLVLLCVLAFPVRAVAAAASRPNILFLLTDDQRADTIHALGNPVIHTPNLDALATSGFVFENAYCMGGDVAAVCLPSRAMLLSGKSLFKLKGNDRTNRYEVNLAQAFNAAGYVTYHHGKSGNTPLGIQADFQQSKYLVNDESERMSGFPGKEIADAAVEFLGGLKNEKPFLIYLAFGNPHDPRVVNAAERSRYDENRIPLPKNFLPLHPFDNGEMSIRDETLAPWPRTEADTRRQLADYYGVITHLDAQIGRVLDALRKSGRSDKTLIVLSSDHGLAMGSHGLFGKQNLYEAGMKAPLIFSGPGIAKGRSPALVYLHDIFPTLCELAGLPAPPGVDGLSLAPVIGGKASDVRDSLLLAYRDGQRAVRLGDWKLIRYPKINVTQLFNLRDDPEERTNLADSEPERVREMMAVLAAKQNAAGDSAPLTSTNPAPREITAEQLNQVLKPTGNSNVATKMDPAVSTAPASTSPPNIIIVMPDDVGYGDFACLGNPIIKTPAVDAFWRESVRFTQFHVSPTCAPTRAAMVTGRHEFKNGVTHTIFERERLTTNATTLAQVLQGAGYATGIFGKWHLGDEAAYQPDRRGFEEVYIHGGGGIGQTYPGSCGDAPENTNINPALLHNGRFEKAQGYCTDLFFAQALKWIDAQRRAGRRFFALIAPNAAHAPLVLPEHYWRQYEGRVPELTAKFFGMIENVDTNFGGLLERLKEWGLEENTLVIFLTDNGGTVGTRIFNAGLRGGKGTPYQGATRVPSFWRWPAGFQGGVDCDALTAHIDMFPTLAELAGAKPSDAVKLQVEGRTLRPLLKDPNSSWPERTLVAHLGRWPRGDAAGAKHTNCAIQNSRFTLVNNRELYDLESDPGETNNIIAEHPTIVAGLRSAYDRWWAEVQPLLVNENVTAPRVNPFKALYWKQFGGGPDAALLKAMDPGQ